MKKISLSKQLFIIYFGVLLITSITFFSIMSGWLIEIYTAINYDKLDEFASTLTVMIEKDLDIQDINFENNIEYVIWKDDEIYFMTENIYDLLDDSYIENIYSNIVFHLIDEEHFHSTVTNIENYFYSAVKTDNDYYILTVTSGLFISQMRQETGYQIMILFLLILFGGGCIVIIWSNSIVRRIANISTFVTGMKSTNYSISSVDLGNDEIGKLSTTIEDMRKQIYDNEETKKEIIQNLSHDIKTPIAVIKSYAEAIVDGVESPDAGIVIIKQSNLLQKKAEKLLQLNRLNYLEMDRTFEKVNMSSLINRVVGNTKYLTNIKFELELDDSTFMGYEENYQTLIENLISNAIRYAHTKIIITLKECKLSFYNDGPNIEQKFLDNGFKAYEIGSQGEFGVGMSIVKKTTEFFNLDFDVQNEQIGVTFTISYNNKNNK